MLVWDAERFGLAQLHQLRGRVGRGQRRGVVYLFGHPDKPLSP
jgi:transcription-repair coupling factor (superfamily II helicase)